MNTLPVIQGLWVGEELSTMERLCFASFLYHGHPYHLYVYNEVKNIPTGVTVKDANEIVPASQVFTYKSGGTDTYAGFSDLFRYKLLLERGGIWADTDFICLRPWQFTQPYLFASQGSRIFQYGSRFIKRRFMVNGCVLQAPRGDELVAHCYEIANQRDPKALKFGQIGPQLMTDIVSKYNLHNYVARPSTFCPINYFRWQRLIKNEPLISYLEKLRIRFSRSYGLHLWHVMWQMNNIDPNTTFANNSLYEIYKRKYLAE